MDTGDAYPDWERGVDQRASLRVRGTNESGAKKKLEHPIR